MNADTEQQAAYGDVLKKIGRNLLLFQQAEGLMKRLVTLGSLSTHAGETAAQFKQRAESCHKMTLGQVANLFLERIASHPLPAADFPATAIGHPGSLSVSVRLQIDSGAAPEEHRQSLDHLIELRNDLVHHLFSSIEPDSPESCAAISRELDEQRRQILPEIQRIQKYLRNAQTVLKNLSAFLDSPEGHTELLLPEIQQSLLIRNLATLAENNTNPGGWLRLGEATQQLKDFPREKIKAHLDQFEQKSLTALMNASRLFELRAEPGEAGHDRMLYRLKSALSSQSEANSVGIPSTPSLPKS